ncbi:unnamed protein product [Knipowitschia caucasica]|uniref:SAYSvFN domain-containing protein n=1 Tax=Knipowitschia caucasica TaxID=637954 RepID=A0AAV2KFI7_KNICA
MEQRLAEFRARRRAAQTAQTGAQVPEQVPEDTGDSPTEAPTLAPPCPPAESHTEQGRGDWLLETARGRWLCSRLAFSNITLLKVLLWLVLMGLFVELEFGLVFFVLSMFYWMYEGLRSPEARQPGELSAYSVFNPDCQPLLGSLTAEQLEGEMGYRPLQANR